MKKTAPATVHVAPDSSGGWLVRASQAGSAQTYRTQAEAVGAAQALVSRSGGQIAVRNANGRTRNSFTLGSDAMEKINAVEGIVLSDGVREALAAFDHEDFSPEQRRTELLSALAGRAKR